MDFKIQSSHYRVLRCINKNCANYWLFVKVFANQFGPFLEWPNIRCICHAEPIIVETENGPVDRIDEYLKELGAG